MTAPELTIEGLFDVIGCAGHDMARAIRENDDDLGVSAASALCNALGMLPQKLRDDFVLALTDRSFLAPSLRDIAL